MQVLECVFRDQVIGIDQVMKGTFSSAQFILVSWSVREMCFVISFCNVCWS